MFDWLFGTKRQTNFDDTNSLYNQYNEANTAANDYYSKNIENANWDSLGQDEKAKRVQEYNTLDTKRQGLGENYGQTYDMFNQENKDRKYDYFGNGLLGSILNPIGQTFTAAGDALSGQYDQKGRDVASDLGAAGQTLLSFLPFAGGLAKAGGILGKAGAGVGKAVNSVPGMALTGAGFNAGETLRQGGSDTDMGDLLDAAGTGAAFGAGIPIAGRLGGSFLRNRGSKVLGRELAQSGVADDAVQQFMSSVPNKALYQTALRSFVPKTTLGKAAVGGGALLGANKLMGGGQQEADPTAQLAAQFQQAYGYTPSEYELQMLMSQGGY